MSKHIRPNYVTSPSYRQEHTLAYKVIMTVAMLVIWAAIVAAAVLAG